MRASRARVVCYAAIPALPAMAAAFWLASSSAQVYRILSSRSRVEVAVKTEGLINHSRGLILHAYDVKGQVFYDPFHPDSSGVRLTVPVKGLEPIAPRMTTDEANYVLNFLRSTWVFDYLQHPEISFVGSGVKFGEPRGSGFFGIHCPGALEMHGRRQRIMLDGIARITSEGIQVTGHHYVRQRDFGMIPLKDLTGTYTIKNDVEVTFDVFAVPEAMAQLKDDEVHPPKLTERAEKSGELQGRGNPPAVTRPEPEVKTKSGEFTDPRWEPR